VFQSLLFRGLSENEVKVGEEEKAAEADERPAKVVDEGVDGRHEEDRRRQSLFHTPGDSSFTAIRW